MESHHLKLVGDLLRRLGREIEGLSEDELRRIVQSKAPLLVKAESGQPSRKTEPSLDMAAAKALHRQLETLNSREEGANLINSVARVRADLVLLAREVDIPVSKRHSSQEVIEKIVEATIGYRSRSAAVRGPSEVARTEAASADLKPKQ